MEALMRLRTLTALGNTYTLRDISHELTHPEAFNKYLDATEYSGIVCLAERSPANSRALQHITNVPDTEFMILCEGRFVAFGASPSVCELRALFPHVLRDNECAQCGAPPVLASICTQCKATVCGRCQPDNCTGFVDFVCSVCRTGRPRKVPPTPSPTRPHTHTHARCLTGALQPEEKNYMLEVEQTIHKLNQAHRARDSNPAPQRRRSRRT